MRFSWAALAAGSAFLGVLTFLPGPDRAVAQFGIVNSVINSAIQMQQQQQAIEAQRRAAERAAGQQKQAEQKKQQAEQKKQQQDKAAVEKQEKFARIVPVAEQLIDEVSAFLKQNPNDPKMLTYASGVANLGKALKGTDPAAVEKQIAALNGLVQKDPRFADFARQRAEERREQNARELVGLVKQAQAQRAFIVGFISRNPTSPAVETLLPSAKALDEALQQPTYETLKPLTETTDMAFRQSGLRSAYLNALADTGTSAAPPPATAAGATAPAAVPNPDALRTSLTEKNRFLLDGSVEDVVFLYNASSEAPHVLKNLKGDIVFERSTASVCIFQKQENAASTNLARRVLSGYGLDTISIDARPCASDKLRSFDVVMVRRATMFREDTAYTLALLRQIELGGLVHLRTVSGSELSNNTDLAAQRAVQIDAQTATGFGFVVLSNASPTVCVVVAQDLPAHERVLSDNVQTIRADMNAAPQFSAMSLDAAFAGVKRGRCAAVYSDAANLKTIIDALKRDGTTYQLLALWVSLDDLEAAKAQVNAALAEAQTQSYERQRAAGEAARIAAARAEEDARTRDAMRTQLRQTYGQKAQAASSIIANEVKAAIDGTDKDPRELYPAFFNWLDEKRRNQWDVFNVSSSVFEYGTVEWKGRRLEVGATRTEIRIRNQTLGEYQDHCFIFAKVFDYEFQATRDFVAIPCGKESQILAWKNARGFKSLWEVP
ncbi:hypothetical protein [Aquabacter cavernae]|uniref:hypothetical protein n=1 Tax=Aquabacter cavernae TaxID=2496029 RepID=UPI000F8E6873|nr:hypothetical protein [Aquabacter cavernae]